MAGCKSCGGGGHKASTDRRRPRASASDRRKSDAGQTADGLTASARYVVVPSQVATHGKHFATLAAAEDYARRTRGIIRPL